MTLSASANAFRSALLSLGPRSKYSPFPPPLRRLALAHLHNARLQLLSDKKAAKQLGLSRATLLRWELDSSPSFHELALFVPPAPAPAPLSFSVSGPRGLRLDGLDLDALVALWSKLS